MAVEVSTKVWNHSQQKNTKLVVMLALANRADEDGICWPGYSYIAQKARLSDERGAMRIVKELTEQGELIIADPGGGRKKSNHYLVTVGFSADHLVSVLTGRYKWDKSAAEAAVTQALTLLNGGEADTVSKNDVDDNTVKNRDENNTFSKNGGKTDTVKNRGKNTTVLQQNGAIFAQNRGNSAQKPWQNCHPIHHVNTSIKKERESGAGDEPVIKGEGGSFSERKVDEQEAVNLLMAVFDCCAIDPDLTSATKLEQAKKAAVKLGQRRKTPDDLTNFRKWWWGNTPPNPAQLLDNWLAFEQEAGSAAAPKDYNGVRRTDNIQDPEQLKAILAQMNAQQPAQPFEYVPPEQKQRQPTTEQREKVAEMTQVEKRTLALRQMQQIVQARSVGAT